MCSSHPFLRDNLWLRRIFLILGCMILSKIDNLISLCPAQDPRHRAAEATKQPQNITEPPPCFTAGMVSFSLKAYSGCNLAKSSNFLNVPLPKGLCLVNMQFGKIQSGFFKCFSLRSGVLLGLLHCSSFSFRQGRVVQLETVAPWARRSSFDLFWSFYWFFLYNLNNLFNLGSIWLLQGCWLESSGPKMSW